MKKQNYSEVLKSLNAMAALKFLESLPGSDDWRQSVEVCEANFQDERDLELEKKIQVEVKQWISKHPNKKVGYVRIPSLQLTVQVFVYGASITYHEITKSR